MPEIDLSKEGEDKPTKEEETPKNIDGREEVLEMERPSRKAIQWGRSSEFDLSKGEETPFLEEETPTNIDLREYGQEEQIPNRRTNQWGGSPDIDLLQEEAIIAEALMSNEQMESGQEKEMPSRRTIQWGRSPEIDSLEEIGFPEEETSTNIDRLESPLEKKKLRTGQWGKLPIDDVGEEEPSDPIGWKQPRPWKSGPSRRTFLRGRVRDDELLREEAEAIQVHESSVDISQDELIQENKSSTDVSQGNPILENQREIEETPDEEPEVSFIEEFKAVCMLYVVFKASADMGF